MKRFLALLGLGLCLWAGSATAQNTVGPPNQVNCNKNVIFSGGAVAAAIVPAIVGQRIYPCGWHVTTSSGSAVTFSITMGTLTTNPCDTGTVALTPALNITSSAPSMDHIDFGIIQSGLSQALCVTPSSATISGVVYYSQF